MDRNSNTSSNPPNAGHNRIITTTTIGGSEDCTQVNNKQKLLNIVGTKVTFTQVDHAPDTNNISSHIHHIVNNKINIRRTPGTSDNYTQGTMQMLLVDIILSFIMIIPKLIW
jgi:hypothetical protein